MEILIACGVLALMSAAFVVGVISGAKKGYAAGHDTGVREGYELSEKEARAERIGQPGMRRPNGGDNIG